MNERQQNPDDITNNNVRNITHPRNVDGENQIFVPILGSEANCLVSFLGAGLSGRGGLFSLLCSCVGFCSSCSMILKRKYQ